MLMALGIALFVLLIIVHELGHYLAARASGVKVEEFGIGFPPRFASKRFVKNGTLYSLNWLPLGGFVRLKGEHDADNAAGSYGAASTGKKAFILMAGVFMNLLAAAFILTVLSFTGLPRLVDNQFTIASDTRVVQEDLLVTYVAEGSPADQAGIEVSDKLISVDGQTITSSDALAPLTESLKGQQIEVIYSDGDELNSREIKLNAAENDDGYLGVSTGEFIVEQSTWSAPIRGIGLTGQFTWLTFQGLLNTLDDLFAGQGAAAADNVAGPVGIVVLLNNVSQAGLSFVLMFVALISVTLAVMNALPIPALDGGRLFVSLLYKFLKKPLTAATEERIHATGMAILLGLVVLITFIDVKRL